MSSAALPSSVAQDLGALVSKLEARGAFPVRCEQSDSFGNFEVTFACKSFTFSVVRDRGQFHTGQTDRELLEAAGLWRSFSGVQSLVGPLCAWVESQNAA